MLKLPANTFNVLLIGGGGREHALAWKMSQSPRLGTLYATHCSNPGIAALAKPIDHEFNVKEAYRLQFFLEKHDIRLVVVGPEDPLAGGITDKIASERVAVFGPSREGARLEADKAWAKQFMRSAQIPTAEARTFTDPAAARAYLKSRDDAQVVKASGLAAGKGVVVAATPAEALEAVERFMVKREFGNAGQEIVIEERLKGPEVSLFALTDGRSLFILESAQDHKRIGEGDTGPNTGGMGAYSPTTLIDEKMFERLQHEVLLPTVDALRRDEVSYRGVIFVGLMLTPGGPKVLEYNCRFGDPECQVLMTRLKGDLVEVLYATATGQLEHVDLSWDSRAAVCVVLASGGYPGEYQTGKPIHGLEQAAAQPDVSIFHAGTRRESSGGLVTAGGRVLNVVALGDTVAEAREKANRAAEMIVFEGITWRRDIASRA